MPAPNTTSPGALARGANQARLELLVGHLRYALDRAAAHAEHPADFPLPAGADSLERLYADCVDRLGSGARRRLAREARGHLRASEAQRVARYGTIGRRAPQASVDTLQQLAGAFREPPYRCTEAELAHDPAGWPAARRATGGTPTQLELFALTISCVKDTRELGKDEIALAGIRQEMQIDAASGSADTRRAVVAPIALGKFAKGEDRPVNRVLASFDLANTPKLCSFDFFLAETDVLKGFQTELKEALNFVPDRLADVFVSVAAAGLLFGAASLIFPGAWPTYLVALVIVAGVLVANGVYAALRDDVFPSVQTAIPLTSPAFLFEGDALATAPQIAQFAKFGGIYQLEYQWRLV